MRTPIAELLGIDLPLLAFSHCRDVVAAVTNAGGFGVLGAASHTPDELGTELAWIDGQVAGRPYGVDLIAPASYAGKGEGRDPVGLWERIPSAHRKFVDELLAAHGVEPLPPPAPGERHRPRLTEEHARDCLDIAFAHPIRLITNALGVPPDYMVARGRSAGVPVAALVGTRQHAVRQVEAGVDIIVAQGTEAGGHVGEVATYFVGQGVGLMNRARLAREVVYAMAEEFAAAVERLGGLLEE